MAERVWSEKDLVRRANRRLAVLQHAQEVSGSVAATCRYYGISRTVFYRWKRRWEDEGLDGLKDRSSAPLHCPTRVMNTMFSSRGLPAPQLGGAGRHRIESRSTGHLVSTNRMDRHGSTWHPTDLRRR